MFAHIGALIVVLMTAGPVLAQAQVPAIAPVKPVKMVVLGDSLSAGLGLQAGAGRHIDLPPCVHSVSEDKQS